MIAAACAAVLTAAMVTAPAATTTDTAPPCRDKTVRVLHAAGFRDHALRVAWAIVHRESNGRNVVPGVAGYNGSDVGIWQINRPAWGGSAWWSESAMSDPRRQSRIVYRILTKRGTYWRPWGLSSPRADSLDLTHYSSWSHEQHMAWIWDPYRRYYTAYPKGCRS